MDYQYYKIHFNLHNVIENKIEAFRVYVKNHPNIIYYDEVLGGDDFEIEVHHKTIGIKKASNRKFKQVIIFDDVRTTGTQSTALAKTLRHFGFGDKFYTVTFGLTG